MTGPLAYLDIHTHGRVLYDQVVSVASLSIEEISQGRIDFDLCCAGIHPWWVEELTLLEIENLKILITQLAQAGNLWAIGETGLDRLYPEYLTQQKELFTWHQDLAELHLLPLVIHNVRCGSDFLEILKKRPPKTPWIFHDFRGNDELVKSILHLHPMSFFSFGISLDNSPQVRELLPKIPIGNLFFETDNQKHLDIHDIYLRGAKQLGVELDFLKSQMLANFKKINVPHD